MTRVDALPYLTFSETSVSTMTTHLRALAHSKSHTAGRCLEEFRTLQQLLIKGAHLRPVPTDAILHVHTDFSIKDMNECCIKVGELMKP